LKPTILSPIRCPDNLYRLCRETPIGHGQPYAQPVFASVGYAAEYCRQVNEQVGRTRDEVVMARLKGYEITDAEELTIINIESQK